VYLLEGFRAINSFDLAEMGEVNEENPETSLPDEHHQKLFESFPVR
jgi:hypothetical protein